MRIPPRLLTTCCTGAASLLLLGCFVDPPTIELPGDEGSDDASAGATSTSGASTSSASSTSPASGPGSSDGVDDDQTTEQPTSDGTDDSTSGAPEDSTTGEPAPRLVFLTAGQFFANLGGVGGADARCAAEAEAAGHSGEFLAWISDAEASPAERFVREGGPWVLADGSTVAEGWDDLADGTLASAIALDAEGQPIDDELAVWTNTDWDGTALGADCQGWTSMAFADAGIFGAFVDGGGFGQWTAWGDPTPFPCENTFHLYCFEQ